MNADARPNLAAALLGLVLLVATTDQGGSGAHATVAVHVALAILVAAAWLGFPPARGRLPMPVTLAFSGLAAVATAGALAAPYGYAALVTLLELSAFAASGWLAARSGPGFVAAVRPWLLAGGAAHGIHAALRAWQGEARPPSTFLNPNHAGAWLGAILLLALFSRPRTRTARLATGLACVPVIAGFLLVGSRGALLGVTAGFAAGLLRIRGTGDRRTRLVLGGVGLAVALVAAFLLAQRFRAGDPFAFQRLRIWRASVAAVLEHPWTGTGPGQFAAAAANLNFALDEGLLRYPRSFATPHSDLLRGACELGWPGAAAVAAVALAALWSLGRRASGAAVEAGTVAALAALAAQAVVEDLSTRPAVHLLFAALAGAALAGPPPWRDGRRTVLRVAGAAVLLIAVGVADVAPYRAWDLTRNLPRGPLTADGRARLDEALRRNPLHPDLWMRRAEDLASSGTFDLEAYALSRDAIERAIGLQPADASFRRGLARLEAKACLALFRDLGTRRRAVDAYAAAEALARRDPFIPIEAAAFQLESGDLEGARRSAERALRIEPNAIPPRILLAAAVLEGGEPEAPEKARKLLDDARAIARAAASVARESAYARALLIVDPSQIGPVERRLAGARPAGS